MEQMPALSNGAARPKTGTRSLGDGRPDVDDLA